MATYATVSDIESRLGRSLSEEETTQCTALLADAGVIIDAYNEDAETDVKCLVTCRMIVRVIGNGTGYDIPIGATQGSMSALGYAQSWTTSSGSSGELYLGKLEKKLLGVGNAIGCYSPVEELVEDD
jgi:hypothetical protein